MGKIRNVLIGIVGISAALPFVHPQGVAANVAAVPGVTDSLVASLSLPTTLTSLPDGRKLVSSQSGSIYIIDANGVKNSNPALALADVCSNSERGLLGVAVSSTFATDGFVYTYSTRGVSPSCVNRVSRFSMSGSTIDPATETILLNDIPSTAGNHNAGDIHFGKDGLLYVSVGDGGCSIKDRALCAGDNPIAQDITSLSGKILRLNADGSIPAGNMSGPIYAKGVRNPFRMSPDLFSTDTKFIFNDVGQGTQEEINELKASANYGWNTREGLCAAGQRIPCDTTAPAGLTNPLHAYNHGECSFITAGALPPAGWLGSGRTYLYADGGCQKIFAVSDLGGANTITTFASGVGLVTDMNMVQEGSAWVLYYTTYANGGEVHRITVSGQPISETPVNAGRFVPVTPVRVMDTRKNLGVSVGKPKAKSITVLRFPAGMLPAGTKAVSVNITGVDPESAGFITAWGPGPQPDVSNLNFAAANETVANAAVLPVTENGEVSFYTDVAAHLIVDLSGYWQPVGAGTPGGRFVSLDPTRILDTRSKNGIDSAIESTPRDLQVAGRAGVPQTGVAAVALVVTALDTNSEGFLSIWPAGLARPDVSSINPMGKDVRANLVIVPVGTNGKVSFSASTKASVVADVAGYFTTNDVAAPDEKGLLQLEAPKRLLDTRRTKDPFKAGETRAVQLGGKESARLYNLTLVNSSAWGFLSAFPASKSVSDTSNVNVEKAGQNRAALAITQATGEPGAIKVSSFAGADVLVDQVASFG
jgi:glucose/arabinose dehydrogenase